MNAQQYPKDVSAIVIPRPNCIFNDSDFSQIEYRVLVALANEKFFLDMFEDPDNDYHTLQASNMYGVDYSSVTPPMRSSAKSFNFGIPYGMGSGSLAILLYGQNNEQTREMAQEKYEMYFKDQPNVRQFFNDVKEMASVNKFTKTYYNRRRYYSFTDKEGKVNNKYKAAALRQAGNAVIQGCLSGDTRIHTQEHGIVKIEEVVNRHLKVWDGGKWSKGDITYSGKKQKCIITFSNGQQIVCSPNHKFLTHIDMEQFVRCEDLVSRDKSSEYHSVLTENKEYLIVESVQITDEYIDMYDVCNTDDGYFVADGVITHNSAADIFKIAVARLFLLCKKYDLFDKFYFTNMVHDECLMEIDVTKLNAEAMLREIIRCMQFELEGFPPLFVGAGFAMSWAKAKGGDAEIHPHLGKQISERVKNVSIFKVDETDPLKVKAKFDKYNYEFRSNKIREYLLKEENKGAIMHPTIGSLLNNFFNYGLPYPNDGEEEQRLKNCLRMFIEDFELPVHVDEYVLAVHEEDKEEEEEYEDGEDGEDGDLDESEYALNTNFKLIDEADKIGGVEIIDLILNFGVVVSVESAIIGIDTRDLSYGKIERLGDYLAHHSLEEEDMEMIEDTVYTVKILGVGNRLMPLPYKVVGVSAKEISKIIKK